jgi:hypothetical protein
MTVIASVLGKRSYDRIIQVNEVPAGKEIVVFRAPGGIVDMAG